MTAKKSEPKDLMKALRDSIDDARQDRERAEYIAGLRALADALEAHPTVPLPIHGQPWNPLGWNLLGDEAQRETAAGIIRELGGTWDKSATVYFYAQSAMRGLHLQIAADREAVCERRVIGTRTVVKQVATAFEDREVKEDVVEWDCGSLLGGAR